MWSVKGKGLQFAAAAIGVIYVWTILSLQALDVSANVPGVVFFLFLPLSAAAVWEIRNIYLRVCEIFAEGSFRVIEGRKKRLLCTRAVFLITLAFLSLYWLAHFPGGMSTDTVTQYAQAAGDAVYNNWHPVIHTLLFFTLPLKTGFHLGLIVFLQILYFSLAFAYLFYVMAENSCPVWLLACMCALVCLNPFLASNMMYPWKDIAMMIFSVLLTAYYIQIVCTKGRWLASGIHQVLFSAVLVLCTYMRHNSILFTLPLAILACYSLNKKTITKILAAVLVFAGGIETVYSVLSVEEPDSRIVETVGLPVSVWCKVMQNNPEALPEETRELFYTFASAETYENEFTGSFNSVKWSENFDASGINALSYGEVLQYTAQCFYCEPRQSLKAFADLTELVWGISGKDMPMYVLINENKYGIVSEPYVLAEKLVTQFENLCSFRVVRVLLGTHGFKLAVLLMVGCLLLAERRISILHLIPLFCYNFGTMLFLSGRDYRFFLINIPLWLAVIFLMLKDQRRFGDNISSELVK